MSRQARPSILFTLLWGACLLADSTAWSQALFPVGGRGLSNINAAWVQDRGQISIKLGGASFYKTAQLKKQTGRSPEFATFWDVQGGLAAHYAFSRRLELSLLQTVYQDTHHDGKGGNFPDDLYLAAKFGSYGGLRSKAKVGFMTAARLPLAAQHNVILEPYSAGSVELGVLGLFSYSKDVLLPENAFNLHLNLGLWHYNDTGKYLINTPADTFAVLSPTRALLWGAGFAIPSHEFDFTFEIYGRNFMTRPPVTAYSREDFAYVTPGVMYHAAYWAVLNVNLDFRISADQDATQYFARLNNQINPELPSYPNWRVRFGAKFALNQPAPPPGQKPLFASANGRLTTAHKTLEKQLTEERKKTESAEDELAKIRDDRKRMETMLARLRSMLTYGKSDTTATREQANDLNPNAKEKPEEQKPEDNQPQ
ncbi:MAG: hypothetical protein ALAOOOJD_02878 [bacterium]|nr:hypothetical protein [bacterium]